MIDDGGGGKYTLPPKENAGWREKSPLFYAMTGVELPPVPSQEATADRSWRPGGHGAQATSVLAGEIEASAILAEDGPGIEVAEDVVVTTPVQPKEPQTPKEPETPDGEDVLIAETVAPGPADDRFPGTGDPDVSDLILRAETEDPSLRDEELAVLAAMGRCPSCGKLPSSPVTYRECADHHASGGGGCP